MREFIADWLGPWITNLAIAAGFVIGGLYAIMPNTALVVIDHLLDWWWCLIV